ncbi:response regulator transcription factor [Streptococcus merionis]|uniref:Transcriptional regulatory protein DltR n=1 Tax=Streptococcus merionis TaxID=400065 RepID=A0A239T1G7_9STRE|nr:response regulator transcription factor [Streptococcus merionis]SNU90663.1 putative two-component response regulator [Streptococcus merionis]
MNRILVVEDDEAINQVICEFLKESHYRVDAAFDGKVALEKFYSNTYDLILLDIMLPSISGLDILKEIRTVSQVPVIVLTALDDEYTQLVSFNHLISDYVTKPFSPLILLKRIENVFRQIQGDDEVTIGELQVTFADRSVKWQGQPVQLTKKEYAILEFLAKNKNKLVMREQLIIQVWGYADLDDRVLNNHIKNLRKKLDGIPLKTVTGMGFILGEEA